MAKIHPRFARSVWAFKKDFLGSLAKNLVCLSPYTVPDNMATIIQKFADSLPYDFDEGNMAYVSLADMDQKLHDVLLEIPEVVALNNRKNGREGNSYLCRFDRRPDPDDDFIDLEALAQCIVVDFAERADADAYLQLQKPKIRHGTTHPDWCGLPSDDVCWGMTLQGVTPEEYCQSCEFRRVPDT